MVLDVIGEKWIIKCHMPDGTINGGICNSYQGLPHAIETLRAQGCRNIVITDETIFWTDAKGD